MRFNNILIDFDRDVWSYIRCAGLPSWLASRAGAVGLVLVWYADATVSPTRNS